MYSITSADLIWIVPLVVWEFTWKALAMWRAARNDSPRWFVAILLINSVGILPILYLHLTKSKPSPK